MSLAPDTLLAGKYRIVKTLGRGGMGVVLEAHHDDLDQRVAIKVMAAHAAQNAEWAARFSREAKLAGRIKSEHVVRVFDVGKLDSGEPYMVMELLEGEDVQALLDRVGRLPVPTAVDYVLQACEALAVAHAAGIVHRDLKPANLFLTSRPDGSAFVKVLDFGISKVTSDVQGVTVTNTSAIVGSPLYMSPEQMRASKSVDARTDLWSLGVIVQQLVTGRPPFDATTTPELCALVLTSPPSRMRDTLPSVPLALEAIVDRCLQKDAAARFGSVAELARALEPFAEGTTKLAVDRIERVAARAPNAPPIAEAPRVSIGDPSDVSAVSETVASEPELAPRTVPEGPTLVSAGAATPAAATPAAATPAATLAQPPLFVASTGAAWGGGVQPRPARRGWLWLAVGGAAIVIASAVAFVVARGGKDAKDATASASTGAGPSAAATSASNTPAASSSITAPASSTSATPPIATTSIAVGALPRSDAPKPTPTGRAAATATTKPPPKPSATATSADPTSEFGGRK